MGNKLNVTPVAIGGKKEKGRPTKFHFPSVIFSHFPCTKVLSDHLSKWLITGVLFFLISSLYSQQDSIQLNEVVIFSYLGDRPLLRLPASAALIDSAGINRQPGNSFVPVLNTVPGIRMEERSPGSYRLSIRGSLIRSPFGIRNTKIYLDEFPLTNAGGDSYLNLIDLNSANSIEVLKGPDGSLFGANSGGVVRISPFVKSLDGSFVRLGIGAGSYGLVHPGIKVQQKLKRGTIAVNAAWQRSDGYREHSTMDRKFIQLCDRLNYDQKAQLRVYFFYSDLNYETPGGLTLAQYKENPRQARPATKFVPGAVGQNASIRNRTFFGGITNDIKISDAVRHVLSVFGSQTSFENPFITNYEIRDEGNAGARSYFEFSNDEESKVRLKWNLGAEFQEMHSGISNYGNNQGKKDTVQAINQLEVRQCFAFTRLLADLNNKWIVEASLSYNTNRLLFTHEQPVRTDQRKKTITPELMPRIAASCVINNFISFRAIISKGYSPPTLQEIRSSDNTVNTSLQAESGWNYETGVRLKDRSGRVYWDLSVFYYELHNAIVKRINDLGQDYFMNAGVTHQPGLESMIRMDLIKQREEGFIRHLQLSNAFTWYDFKFGSYETDVTNYSGKELTGVPRYVSVTGITLHFPLHFYLFMQHNYTERIPLNDLNSEYASAYNLVQIKAGWTFRGKNKFILDLSVGADNLLNERYSLGNDLNALGNRYYNAAAPRNYFGRITIGF